MIMVSYNTRPQTKVALSTFLSFYPSLPIIVVDNHSQDGSVGYIQSLPVDGVFLYENVGHGPALDLAIQSTDTPYIFTLDSDTRTHHGGFIEQMSSIFDDDANLFALGLFYYSTPGGTRFGHLPSVHPSAMMMRKSLYLQGRPFVQAGQPVHLAMADARERGNRISGFPIYDYIDHFGGSTRCLRERK